LNLEWLPLRTVDKSGSQMSSHAVLFLQLDLRNVPLYCATISNVNNHDYKTIVATTSLIPDAEEARPATMELRIRVYK
jgi:hypothetical protein